jgi:ComF family protein
MRALASAVADLLFPPRCEACLELLATGAAATPSLALCGPCLATIERVEDPCERCGQPGMAGGCTSCERRPPTWDRAQAVYVYGGAVADMLHRFKYEDQPALARPLAERLARVDAGVVDVVAPIPLSTRRRLGRTYDQALLLARELASLRGLRFEGALLRRVRHTGRQVDRRRDERQENVRGAFRLAGEVHGLSVLLVDDVVTTGATAGECARLLKEGGARRVEVVSVARA